MLKLLFIAGIALMLNISSAAPVRCSPGYQDASCASPLSAPPQTAPSCSADAGWQTITAATWIGSKYSTPVCSYTAPPTCPPGNTQLTPATWNGTTWTGLVCSPVKTPECGTGQVWNGTTCVADTPNVVNPTYFDFFCDSYYPAWDGSYWEYSSCGEDSSSKYAANGSSAELAFRTFCSLSGDCKIASSSSQIVIAGLIPPPTVYVYELAWGKYGEYCYMAGQGGGTSGGCSGWYIGRVFCPNGYATGNGTAIKPNYYLCYKA